MQGTGPTIYSPCPKRLERLTICRCTYKGGTFFSVFLRPWVLVRSGVRILDLPHSSLLLYHNWANQPVVSFIIPDKWVSSFHIDYHSLHKWHNWIVRSSKRKITAQDKTSNRVCWSKNCARCCWRTSPCGGPRAYFIRKQSHPLSIGRSGKTWQ